MPSYTISKRFRFEAAHHLTSVPPEHKCRRPHGHSYVATLYLGAKELDEHGFVIDYAALDSFKTWLAENVDHRDLNELDWFRHNAKQTTAENIATWLASVATNLLNLGLQDRVALEAVCVEETIDTTAEWTPE